MMVEPYQLKMVSKTHTLAWQRWVCRLSVKKVTTDFRLGLSVGSVANATAALTAIDTAIEQVQLSVLDLVLYENRLDSAISNLTTYKPTSRLPEAAS